MNTQNCRNFILLSKFKFYIYVKYRYKTYCRKIQSKGILPLFFIHSKNYEKKCCKKKKKML